MNPTNKAEMPTKYPYYMSRVIHIKRKPVSIALPGTDPNEGVEKIGSSLKEGGAPARGLTKDEERRFFPELLGVDSKSSNFEEVARDYWDNISVAVPPSDKTDSELGGLKLEVGLRFDTEKDYKEYLSRNPNKDGVIENPPGDPINIAHYILWRYCLVYSDVANDISLLGKSPKIRFYMYAREKQIADKKAASSLKREAVTLYNKQIGDRSWVNWMLRNLIAADKDKAPIMIKDVGNISKDEQDVMLYDYCEKDPAKFIKLGEDKDLELKDFIEVAVATGHLDRVPNTDTITREGLTLGNTIQEAVTFLNNPKNAEVYRSLKAQVNLAP